MTGSDEFVGLLFLVIGISLIYQYMLAARLLFSRKLDLVQAIVYRINTRSMPLWKRILERVLRFLKFMGLLLAVVGLLIATGLLQAEH